MGTANVKDFESARALWSEAPLMAPTYVLLCGADEATLITRDEGRTLRPLTLSAKSEQKYLLQTNVDHWLWRNENENAHKKKGKKKKKKKKQIANDTMDSARRLNAGHKCLKEQEGKLTNDGMWRLLSQYPIHDRSWTIYSTVMNVKRGEYKTVRHLHK